MNVYQIRADFGQDCFSGDIGLEVVLSGCAKALKGNPCKNCHTPFLWDFDVGKPLDLEEIKKKLLYYPYDAFILLGGDPLDHHPKELYKLVSLAKQYVRYVFVWTGYEYDELLKDFNSDEWKLFWNCVDYVKVGRYIPELPKKGKLASSNQRVLKLKGGLESATEVSFE